MDAIFSTSSVPGESLNSSGASISSTKALAMFTAARIAHVLGRDKRGLLRILRRVPAAGKILVQRGQLADAWTITALPDNYRATLERMAKDQGCRTVEQLLSSGAARWQPPIRMTEIARHHLDMAIRLKSALARAIEHYQNSAASIGEVRAAAWEDYQKEFGVVCERTPRRMLDRVILRDAGEENFDDLALYLGERLSKEDRSPAILSGLLSPHEQALFQSLAAVKTPSEPGIPELDQIWFTACEAIYLQAELGAQPKRIRRSIIDLLSKSGVRLSRNTVALKKLLKLKYARYLSCARDINAMNDQRGQKSGWKRALALPEEDRQLIVGHAAQNKGGRLAPALRELRQDGKLGAEFEMRHVANPASKSYVPKSIRDQVQPDIRRLKNMVHGPRTNRLLGPHITRSYSAMAAGDWYQADDVTAPVYFFEDTPKGLVLMRGQFLVMIDVRADFVLGFMLIPERNYDSLAIRSLITICAAKHGLPRKGFYFERGIWKSSRIISGRRAVQLSHADRGLRGLGMELRHAQLPRGKVVERTIGQLQNRMEGLPGYVGRDERYDLRERAQRDFLDAKAGRRPINEVALSKEQYCEKLAQLIDDHNAEVQQGRLDGLSPAEAWERLQGSEPRQGFENKWRYVLARDVRKIKVGRNGITLQYGKKKFVYHDAETGKRVGEEVLAWFDPMLPDVLPCTDLNHRNPFSVERANEVPAMDAPDDLLRDEMRKIEAHQDYAKTLYWTSRNALKANNYLTTIADAQTLEIGSAIDAQRQQITTRKDQLERKTRANRGIIEQKGLPRELLGRAGNLSTETVETLGKFLNSDDGQPGD